MSANVGGVSSAVGVGTLFPLEKDEWSMVKRPRQATNEYAPPPAFPPLWVVRSLDEGQERGVEPKPSSLKQYPK